MSGTDATRCKVCGGPFSAKRTIIDGEQYHERCALMSHPSHTWEDYARLSAQLATARKALEAAKEALLSNAPHGPQKTVCVDGVIYHLDGQTVGHALNLIRAALNSGEQKQIEDWPYPEGNPTCAQDLK